MKTLKILQHHNTATPPHSPTALSSREEERCSCTRLGRVVSLCCLQQAAVQVVRVLSSLGEKLKHEQIRKTPHPAHTTQQHRPHTHAYFKAHRGQFSPRGVLLEGVPGSSLMVDETCLGASVVSNLSRDTWPWVFVVSLIR